MLSALRGTLLAVGLMVVLGLAAVLAAEVVSVLEDVGGRPAKGKIPLYGDGDVESVARVVLDEAGLEAVAERTSCFPMPVRSEPVQSEKKEVSDAGDVEGVVRLKPEIGVSEPVVAAGSVGIVARVVLDEGVSEGASDSIALSAMSDHFDSGLLATEVATRYAARNEVLRSNNIIGRISASCTKGSIGILSRRTQGTRLRSPFIYLRQNMEAAMVSILW